MVVYAMRPYLFWQASVSSQASPNQMIRLGALEELQQ